MLGFDIWLTVVALVVVIVGPVMSAVLTEPPEVEDKPWPLPPTAHDDTMGTNR